MHVSIRMRAGVALHDTPERVFTSGVSKMDPKQAHRRRRPFEPDSARRLGRGLSGWEEGVQFCFERLSDWLVLPAFPSDRHSTKRITT